MRNYVAPFLCAAMMMGTAILSGCTGQMSLSAGAGTPEPAPAATPAPAAQPEQPAAAEPVRKKTVNFTMEGGALKLPGPVVFETGSDVLKPESDEVLMIVNDYLEAKPRVSLLRVEGHTDNVGKDEDNQVLSEKRALAVSRWLVAKGTDCKRLIPVGFGASKSIADNATPEGKAQNRRTAFVNAAIDGKPIGGMPVDGGGKVAGDPCK